MTGSIRWLARGLAAALVSLCALAVAQEKFPARTMEMMVPWGPGGGADTIGRLVARWLETDLGASVPVVNTAGATGVIGLSKLMQAPGDGHNLGILTSDTLMVIGLAPRTLKYADVLPLAVLSRQPSGLFVRGDSRFKSWNDIVAEAKAKPGTVSVATTGPGSPDDASIDYLATKGIKMTSVAYAKPGERYAAVLGGHVDLLFEQAGDIKGHVDGKTLRPVLFFMAQRVAAPFADVPVAGELGYDFLPPQLRALVVRADTDPKKIALLSASLDRFAASKEYAAYLKDQLALPDSFVAAAAAQGFLAQDLAAMKRVNALLPVAAK